MRKKGSRDSRKETDAAGRDGPWVILELPLVVASGADA